MVLLAAVTSSACSTPVAVGSMLAGGGALVGAKVIYKEDCDGEGCGYGNLLAVLLGTIGFSFFVGGSVGLAVENNRD